MWGRRSLVALVVAGALSLSWPRALADARLLEWSPLLATDSLAIHTALQSVALERDARRICAELLASVDSAAHGMAGSPALVRDGRVSADGRAAYWDGERIRIDAVFLSRASGSGLVAAVMHEMAHRRGFTHAAPTARRGWYDEFPFRHLDFTEDENFDGGWGRCLRLPTDPADPSSG